MSDASTNGAVASSPKLTAEQVAMLRGSEVYQRGTVDEQAALERDMAVALAEGLSADEYLTGLGEYLSADGTTVADYLAESAPEEPSKPEGEQPAPGQSVTEAARQAAEAEAARVAARRAELDAMLAAAVAVFRKGESAYRNGLLEAGRLCSEYVSGRVALGGLAERPNAVKGVEADLGRYSSEEVKANRLIKAWEAWRLLAMGPVQAGQGGAGLEPGQPLHKGTGKRQPAVTEGLPYGHLRDQWARLVDRMDTEDERVEVWVLLPGLEAECCECFKQATTARLSKAAVAMQVDKLLAEHKRRTNAQAQQAAQQAAEQAKAAEQAALVKDRELLVAQSAARDAEAKAAAEQDATAKAAREAEAARLREEQERLRREKEAADFAAQQAERERVKRDQEAREAKRLQDIADAKEAKTTKAKQGKGDEPKPATAGPAPAPSATPAKQPECRGENVLATLAKQAKSAQPRDFAGMLAGPVHGADDPLAVVHELARALVSTPDKADYGPDDVFAAFVDALVDHPGLSGKGKRAVKAALLVLSGKPTPADVANQGTGNTTVTVTAGK